MNLPIELSVGEVAGWVACILMVGALLGYWLGRWGEATLWRGKAKGPIAMCSGGKFYYIREEGHDEPAAISAAAYRRGIKHCVDLMIAYEAVTRNDPSAKPASHYLSLFLAKELSIPPEQDLQPPPARDD